MQIAVANNLMWEKPVSLLPGDVIPPGDKMLWINGSNVDVSTDFVALNLFGGGNAVQATAMNKPVLTASALNGLPIVQHDSNLKALQAGITTSGGIYAISVMRIASFNLNLARVLSAVKTGETDILGANSGAVILRNLLTSGLTSFQLNAQIGSGYAQAAGSFITIETHWDNIAGRVKHWINGTQTADDAWVGALASDAIKIGDPLLSLVFDWAEIICAKTITANNQGRLRRYLQNKYAHY